MSEAPAWIGPGLKTFEAATARISDPVLTLGRGWRWWIALAISLALTAVMIGGIVYALATGVGVWGNNTAVVWGFPIANYVWWIGVGNAGTLISSMLLLMNQPWRASINRMAEAMTIVAVSIAGLFPIIHLGRSLYFYWTAPYPNTMSLWPQWRSALVWDFWAILAYLLFSILFFYTSLIPDLATLRDRARRLWVKRIYGAFALGWRGSLRHWMLYRRYHRMMAALAVPLVCSVHSIVGLDFAVTLMPGWNESLFPPYFVVGALFSGFGMVVLLCIGLRQLPGLADMITDRHFDVMAKVMLASSCVMGLSYATEWFSSWYGSSPAEHRFLRFSFTGTYAWLFYLMLFCNVVAPQSLWWPAMRRRVPVVALVSLLILVGMWFERMLIILNTLSHGHLPSMWTVFMPTLDDFAVLFGSVGFFALLILLFTRFLPTVSIHEMRALLVDEGRA